MNPPDHIEPGIADGENTCAHGHYQQHETVAFACYFLFRPGGELTILIRGLDNSSNRESVWWMACQAHAASAIEAISGD
jgi:hypothetical protein